MLKWIKRTVSLFVSRWIQQKAYRGLDLLGARDRFLQYRNDVEVFTKDC